MENQTATSKRIFGTVGNEKPCEEGGLFTNYELKALNQMTSGLFSIGVFLCQTESSRQVFAFAPTLFAIRSGQGASGKTCLP